MVYPLFEVYKRHQDYKISGRTVVSPDLPKGTITAVSVLSRGLSSLHIFLLWPEICFAFILASCSIQMNTDAEQTLLRHFRKNMFKIPTLSRKRWVYVVTYSCFHRVCKTESLPFPENQTIYLN